ncbi:hypothetical protein DV515_00002686 [Chloebia gouldiae]|uniref:Uncharacterized protein n=1 Tax=Chloebia gouldiae TaxID=44316 RepID=A0A3L8SUF9_CHLGU|nr:hypothetical protein DV515_00002686 [Chloebia gouldiae]
MKPDRALRNVLAAAEVAASVAEINGAAATRELELKERVEVVQEPERNNLWKVQNQKLKLLEGVTARLADITQAERSPVSGSDAPAAPQSLAKPLCLISSRHRGLKRGVHILEKEIFGHESFQAPGAGQPAASNVVFLSH